MDPEKKGNIEPIVQQFHTEISALDEEIAQSNDLSRGIEFFVRRGQITNNAVQSFFTIHPPDFPFLGLAVGNSSNGRCPHSDFDFQGYTFTLGDEGSQPYNSAKNYRISLREFLERLHISSNFQMNTPDDIQGYVKNESLEEKQKKMTALLDASPLLMHEELHKRVEEEFRKHCDRAAFAIQKVNLIESIQEGTSLHDIDFNIKEDALRELDAALWLQRISNEYLTLEKSWELLKDDSVKDALSTLLRVRIFNHMHIDPERKLREKEFENALDNIDSISHETYDAFFGKDIWKKITQARHDIRGYVNHVLYETLGEGKGIPISGTTTFRQSGIQKRGSWAEPSEFYFQSNLDTLRLGEPIHPDEKRELTHHVSKYLKPHILFLDILKEEKSAKILEILLSDNALPRILPGFETLYQRYENNVLNPHSLMSERAIQRIRNLNTFDKKYGEESEFYNREVIEDYTTLPGQNKAAIHIALLVKEIEAQKESTHDYLQQLRIHWSEIETPDTLWEDVQFLLENTRTLPKTLNTTLWQTKIDDFKDNEVSSLDRLKMLLYFTIADLDYGTERRSQSQWDEMFTLYRLCKHKFNGEELILPGFYANFEPEIVPALQGELLGLTERFSNEGALLASYIRPALQAKRKETPHVHIENRGNNLATLVVGSPNKPGLLWKIAKVCYDLQARIDGADVYTLHSYYDVAFDLFDIQFQNKQYFGKDIFAEKLEAIQDEDIDIREVQDILLGLEGKAKLKCNENYILTVDSEMKDGIIYAVAGMLSYIIEADIHKTSLSNRASGEVNRTLIFTAPHDHAHVYKRINKFLSEYTELTICDPQLSNQNQ